MRPQARCRVDQPSRPRCPCFHERERRNKAHKRIMARNAAGGYKDGEYERAIETLGCPHPNVFTLAEVGAMQGKKGTAPGPTGKCLLSKEEAVKRKKARRRSYYDGTRTSPSGIICGKKDNKRVKCDQARRFTGVGLRAKGVPRSRPLRTARTNTRVRLVTKKGKVGMVRVLQSTTL